MTRATSTSRSCGISVPAVIKSHDSQLRVSTYDMVTADKLHCSSRAPRDPRMRSLIGSETLSALAATSSREFTVFLQRPPRRAQWFRGHFRLLSRAHCVLRVPWYVLKPLHKHDSCEPVLFVTAVGAALEVVCDSGEQQPHHSAHHSFERLDGCNRVTSARGNCYGRRLD